MAAIEKNTIVGCRDCGADVVVRAATKCGVPVDSAGNPLSRNLFVCRTCMPLAPVVPYREQESDHHVAGNMFYRPWPYTMANSRRFRQAVMAMGIRIRKMKV